ncbi:MAG: TfoX/Sxy family protein, partial [Oscillospiraceae bacterium]
MATSKEYIEFVCEQIEGIGYIRYRKMFGEYMVYLNDKPIFLVCDNTVFIKKSDEVKSLLDSESIGTPYE